VVYSKSHDTITNLSFGNSIRSTLLLHLFPFVCWFFEAASLALWANPASCVVSPIFSASFAVMGFFGVWLILLVVVREKFGLILVFGFFLFPYFFANAVGYPGNALIL